MWKMKCTSLKLIKHKSQMSDFSNHAHKFLVEFDFMDLESELSVVNNKSVFFFIMNG